MTMHLRVMTKEELRAAVGEGNATGVSFVGVPPELRRAMDRQAMDPDQPPLLQPNRAARRAGRKAKQRAKQRAKRD